MRIEKPAGDDPFYNTAWDTGSRSLDIPWAKFVNMTPIKSIFLLMKSNKKMFSSNF